MARRKSKAKPRSRSKPKLNLIDTGVSLIIANSVSQNITGLDLRNFLFAGTTFSTMDQWGGAPNTVSSDGNQRITLKEVFAGGQGAANRPSIGEVFTNNFKANWVPLTVAVVGVPMIAKVSKKLLRAPILTPVNRMLKMSGLGVKV